MQYNTEKVRDGIIRFSSGISIIPLVIDAALVRAARNLDLYVEPENEPMEKINEAETAF